MKLTGWFLRFRGLRRWKKGLLRRAGNKKMIRAENLIAKGKFRIWMNSALPKSF
jgi:hypothetical protein